MQHFWEQVDLKGYSIYFDLFHPESEIAGKAGIAEIVMIDFDELWTLIPE